MLQQIDHVNIVVRDLPRMERFYTRVLGLTVTKRVTIHGPWIDAVVGLRDVEAEVIYLDAPQGPRIELIRYINPEEPPVDGLERPNLPGLRHLAFRVSGIEQAAQRIREAGVHLVSDVQEVPASQVSYAGGARKRLVYFHDPEGNLLELCEYA